MKLSLLLIITYLSLCNCQNIREEFIKLLRVKDVLNIDGNKLRLERLGSRNDGGYVVAVESLEESSFMFGYGIADNASFEEHYSQHQGKKSFGFDCGINSYRSNQQLFSFVSECIGSDRYIYNTMKKNNKISSFQEQLERYGIKGKKMFLKMDIEGAEYDVLEDILEHYHQSITGIVIEIHDLDKNLELEKALSLVRKLNSEFILINLHGNNNCAKHPDRYKFENVPGFPYVVELTYINKNLSLGNKIKENQQVPAELDLPNNPNSPDCFFVIPK